jgi:peptidoglycan-N-acetylglucosamine deacetylase
MQDLSLLTQRILENVKPGSIILLHDGGGDRSGTVRAVELIIPELRRRNFRFVTVSELLAHAREITSEHD